MYLSSQHAKALANIEFGLTNRDNFVVISGDIGVGKTTLLNQVLEDLPRDVVIAHLTHTTLTPTELLQNILLEFKIESFKKNKVYLLKLLTNYFRKQKEAGKQVAILIDEAQNLSKKSLEELRLLSCQELDLSGLVSIVLLGQPELNRMIDSPELEQLSQRTRIRQHILPLNEKETSEYLARRLEVAGGKIKKIMTAKAIDLVFAYTSGTPRMVNTLCEMAFTAAWVDKAKKVDVAHIENAAKELRWQVPTATVQTLSEDVETDEPRGWLLQTDTSKREKWVPIDELPFFLGRSATTSLQLRHPHISRRHAFIDGHDGELFVQDYNSYNGTYVNGKRIRREHQLTDADIIGFGGGLQLIFHSQAEAPAEAGIKAIPA
ncbi:MAG: AAA family ATPase [Gammaproteobacteria bacterium]|jgi:type II secretory pathway predicted ATPase ExeA|nr:AAA family ATPase [Gammaproteobacteria bacterium]HJP03550.1 AAA family ATPase [Gammaproteobacteria bacterium]